MVYFALVSASFAMYLLSFGMPLLTVSKLYIFEDQLSLLSIITTLVHNSEWFLFVVIITFVIILPIVKFILLFLYALKPTIETQYEKLYLFSEKVSKWAMLDVFIVAFIIVMIKFGLLTSAATELGLYLFTFSILISIFCSQTRKYWLECSDLN